MKTVISQNCRWELKQDAFGDKIISYTPTDWTIEKTKGYLPYLARFKNIGVENFKTLFKAKRAVEYNVAESFNPLELKNE